jgi:hypothetical protein
VKKLVNRLAFGLWIVGAPFVVLGCAEDASKPASTPAPAPAPGPADAGKPADDAAKK